MFRDTITCPHCRDHFTSMLTNYRRIFPNMLQSRQEFALFTFRAHNIVNRRLKKPTYASLDECMATLKNNIKTRPPRDYRLSYLNHITRYWRTYQDITGITALRKVAEMRKIDMDYIQPRDTLFAITLTPDIVLLPLGILEAIPEEARSAQTFSARIGTPPAGGLRLTSAGFRMRR